MVNVHCDLTMDITSLHSEGYTDLAAGYGKVIAVKGGIFHTKGTVERFSGFYCDLNAVLLNLEYS